MWRIIIGLVAVATLLFPAGADAHQYRSDGEYSVVVHVFPDDNPVAHVETKIHIDIQQAPAVFLADGCECRVTITDSSGHKVYDQSLFDLGGHMHGVEMNSHQIVMATFPAAGIYDLVVTGSSQLEQFPSFSVSFDLRVAGGEVRSSGENVLWYAVGASILLVLGLHIYYTVKTRKHA